MKIFTAVVFAALLLAGCGTQDDSDPTNVTKSNVSNVKEIQKVTLNDGREVTCLIWKSGYAGGLSCDWDGAK